MGTGKLFFRSVSASSYALLHRCALNGPSAVRGGYVVHAFTQHVHCEREITTTEAGVTNLGQWPRFVTYRISGESHQTHDNSIVRCGGCDDLQVASLAEFPLQVSSQLAEIVS